MKIIYLHHSGFVVELDKNTLVFDAITYIQPQYLKKGRRKYFFASHAHTDHFSQIIYNYGTDFDTRYILSDLNWWDWSPEARPEIDRAAEERDFKAEIAKIKEFLETNHRKINVAFVPVDSRLGRSATKAAEYFVDELHPQILAPMHCWDEYSVITDLQQACYGKDVKILTMSKRNEIIYAD